MGKGTLMCCSVILMAMVMLLVLINNGSEVTEKPDEISDTQKAIIIICDTTTYKETCINKLNSAEVNSTDPRDLIQIVFEETIKYMHEAAKNSTMFREFENDPRTKSALEACTELANNAAHDLHRSLDKFKHFDVIKVNDVLLDLKIWISGAMTHQETCLDGFQNVSSEAGERMKGALEIGMEMSSNVLAMVEELSMFLEIMGMQTSVKRRLFSIGIPFSFPNWIDFNTRKLLSSSLHQIRPNMIVAQDGSGMFATINDALREIPQTRTGIFVLYIKEGVYEEHVRINCSLTHLWMIGDGPNRTRITGKLNFVDGVGTYHTATVAVHGDSFVARGVGFENSAGPEKHQAVALRVSADKAVFYNCRMDGYQNTLYAHTYRQFYRDCIISGTIDFVFGDGAVVLQGCTMLVRKPLENQQCIVTSQGRKDIHQPTGLVLQNCTIRGDDEYLTIKDSVKSYLGRPWKEYSRTIIMESFLDDLINPEGWLTWDKAFATKTVFYTEFNNRGPAAQKKGRVKWPGVKELPPERVKRFTAAEFIDGNRWVPSTKVPYGPGFLLPMPKKDPNIKYSDVVPEENKDLGVQPQISNIFNPANVSTNSQRASASRAGSPPPSPPSQAGSPPPSPSQVSNLEPIAEIVIDTSPAASPTFSPAEIFEPVAPTAESEGPANSHGVSSPSMAPTTELSSPTNSYGVTSPSMAPGESPESNADSPAPTDSHSVVSPSLAPSDAESPAPTKSYTIVSPSMAPSDSNIVNSTSLAPAGSPQAYTAVPPTASPTDANEESYNAAAPAPTPNNQYKW